MKHPSTVNPLYQTRGRTVPRSMGRPNSSVFRDWGIPEWFIVSQALLFAALFIPGVSVIRLLTKVASFGASLLALWLVWRTAYFTYQITPQPFGRSQHCVMECNISAFFSSYFSSIPPAHWSELASFTGLTRSCHRRSWFSKKRKMPSVR